MEKNRDYEIGIEGKIKINEGNPARKQSIIILTAIIIRMNRRSVIMTMIS